MQKIIITSNSIKIDILKRISKSNKLYNIKFYDFNSFKKKLYFDYDDNTLEYIISNYKVNLSIAKIYMDNIYYLDISGYEDNSFICNLKKELESNKLLIRDKLFKEYIKDKEIYVYGYSELTKEEKLILKDLKYELINEDNNYYIPKLYVSKNIDEEVEFVLNEIGDLIERRIDITNIKIICSDIYYKYLDFYFKLNNIPINIKSNNSYYGTIIASDFLKLYDNYEIDDAINLLKERYDNIGNIINIINKSALVNDKSIRKEFIINDLKNTYIDSDVYDKSVEICSIDDVFSSNDYVFLLGFNLGNYPKTYKDDDYLSDKIKEILKIDTSVDKNIYNKNRIINRLRNINNLVITYPLEGENGISYPSFLIDDLLLESKNIDIDYHKSYSLLNLSLKYASSLDLLYKFNEESKNLKLFQNNLNIRYKEYNHSYEKIKKIKDNIDTLNLSYTSLESYYECSFKYYLKYILNLDIFLNTFKTDVGLIAHHILETGLEKDIDINKEIKEFIKNNNIFISSREEFYLSILESELRDVLNYLHEQEKNSSLNKYLYETELNVYKNIEDKDIHIKGIIDKIMYSDKVLLVVDYKTGMKSITLDTLKYGINIQLPMYLYLIKNDIKFKDFVIGGFYLEKVLGKNIRIKKDKSLLEQLKEEWKLVGYSNSSEQILELIDKEYKNSKMIKNLKYKKDGTISGYAKVLDNNSMDNIIKKVDNLIFDASINILDGNFLINPKVVKNENIACKFCKFKDICYMKKYDEVILEVGDDDEVDNRAVGSNN